MRVKAGTTLQVATRELDGQRLFLVDGLFGADLVGMLYEMLKRQSFSLSDYDTEATSHLRHWKCEFAADYFAANPVFGRWHAAIVGKTVELFAGRPLELGRVHCNNHLYGDLQNPHTDYDPGVTALYFANPEWREEWQGETIFYDRAGEPFHAVAPRPGRLLLFDGAIVHRGGVPSRSCFEPRLSVAFKFRAG